MSTNKFNSGDTKEYSLSPSESLSENHQKIAENLSAVTFVNEGNSNLTEQKEIERLKKNFFEQKANLQRKNTLEYQLRQSAISKNRDFKKKLREKNSFNRISRKENDYYYKLKRNELNKLKEIDSQVKELERLQRLKNQASQLPNDNIEDQLTEITDDTKIVKDKRQVINIQKKKKKTKKIIKI
ncbi:Fyv6p SCDLUD_002867 [Saccharomycodes ludwigii]|uniref:Fyv6p n=1 Tax=Saccharomycodes ludwigii TaxID=36035 RepID=UPI001E8C4CBB|nr:hypothetical protein SCDLUD_002867 [Saccharomycodes ludwigii]KAH3901375.1 hypothetical protein SCDLUD_002867 [Saccharomycodes ludwigii]